MSDDLVKLVRKVMSGVTKGPWGTEGMRDHDDWCVDTGGENAFDFIGPNGRQPVCITVVNEAFSKDHILDANTRFIAASRDLVPAMADRIEELEAILWAADYDAKEAETYTKKLEAKLAKAIRALDEAMYFIDIEEEDILKGAGMYRIVKAYAELGALIPVEWADALKRVAELTGGKDE